jgi:hypothetical protein
VVQPNRTVRRKKFKIKKSCNLFFLLFIVINIALGACHFFINKRPLTG